MCGEGSAKQPIGDRSNVRSRIGGPSGFKERRGLFQLDLRAFFVLFVIAPFAAQIADFQSLWLALVGVDPKGAIRYCKRPVVAGHLANDGGHIDITSSCAVRRSNDSNRRLVMFRAGLGLRAIPEVKYFALSHAVGNSLAVHFIVYNQHLWAVRSGIDSQCIVPNSERLSEVRKSLHSPGYISADAIRDAIVGGLNLDALTNRAHDPDIQ